jgi:hypothetical protein
MAQLQAMPQVVLDPTQLQAIGAPWDAETVTLPKAAGEAAGKYCDQVVAASIAAMLGSIPVVPPVNREALLPPQADCVELGPSRVIGGIRPQNFDVSYRPDGVRFVYDNKTLNTKASLAKNYQNMLNDLGTEAATVHVRFPYAVVAFVVMVPDPCLVSPHRANLTSALKRISRRGSALGVPHKAEVISFIVWDPVTGQIDPDWPPQNTHLRIGDFAEQVQEVYLDRYGGLPPHD